MLKITDANFQLPIIYPTEIVGELTTGANCPVHIRGFDKVTNKKDEYVVKLRDSERMSDPAAAMRELLAAFMGMEMDIPVAEPVAIEITPEIADLTDKPWLKQRFLNSIGLNFGTLHLGLGFQMFALLSSFPQKLERQAQDLVAFDLLLQNPDRTKEKPNMLIDGTHLVAFDHELAFSFDNILFAPINLWQQTGDFRRWINQLVLLPRVKGINYNFNEFAECMERLNDDFWNRCETLVPASWKHQSFDSIKFRMLDFVSQRDNFINELKRILS
jgi:hypothetical protein